MATRNAFTVGCLAAALATAAPAHAAAPKPGDWDSRSPFPPVASTLATVNFEVTGPPSRRIVRRVAAPPWCTAEPASTGYLSAGPAAAPARADGRFAIFGGGVALRGRFVTPSRADGVSCRARGIPAVGALAFPFQLLSGPRRIGAISVQFRNKHV